VNKQDNVAVINVQEVEKFEAFLKLVKNGKIEHWQNIADAIGVHRNTISQWRKHPEAIKATINGINHAIEQMEKVGGRDWKMWREKLEMLGIKGKESPLIAQQFNISEGKEVSDEQLAKRIIGIVERLKAVREGEDNRDDEGSGQRSSVEGDTKSK
jgi:hypothetical protein